MDFLEQLQAMAEANKKQHMDERIYYHANKFIIDVTEMLTDDIAAILVAFKDQPKELEGLVEQISDLPYMHQLDIIKYVAQTPAEFEALCNNSNFAEYMDAFATRVFPNNLKDE